jgi:hypothetical protein
MELGIEFNMGLVAKIFNIGAAFTQQHAIANHHKEVI